MNSPLLEQFDQDGYVILPEKVPESVIDDIVRAFDNAADNREKILLRKGGRYKHPGPLGIVGHRQRVIDFYVPCEAALQAALYNPITQFLTQVYAGEAPLAFQSLLFQYGSRQDMHQDTAYVVTDAPLQLTASWIALEDIKPGTGELAYYKGSHKDINIHFESGKTIWDRQTDSQEVNKSYAANLSQACEAAGLQRETFCASKGEVLIWHAGLVHGGTEVKAEDREQTRKSLVTHYCPSSGQPNYFKIKPEYAYKKPYGDGFYCSRHYDLRPDSNNPYPIYTGGVNIAEMQGLEYKDIE